MELLFFTPVVLVFSLISAFLVFSVATVFIIFLSSIFRKKITRSHKKIVYFIFFALYLTLGMYFSYDYVLFPERYDPQYISWLESTPLLERFSDITAWPALWIANRIAP